MTKCSVDFDDSFVDVTPVELSASSADGEGYVEKDCPSASACQELWGAGLSPFFLKTQLCRAADPYSSQPACSPPPLLPLRLRPDAALDSQRGRGAWRAAAVT